MFWGRIIGGLAAAEGPRDGEEPRTSSFFVLVSNAVMFLSPCLSAVPAIETFTSCRMEFLTLLKMRCQMPPFWAPRLLSMICYMSSLETHEFRKPFRPIELIRG